MGHVVGGREWHCGWTDAFVVKVIPVGLTMSGPFLKTFDAMMQAKCRVEYNRVVEDEQ